MNIYPPDTIDKFKYEHLNQSNFKKIFCTYLTFNKTTLEWYGGETTLYKHLNGYPGSGSDIKKHLKKWKKKLGKNWKNNFICLLDECFETKAEAKSRESELVNNDTRDELCLNILNGGGGWDYGEYYPEETRKKMSKSCKIRSQSEQWLINNSISHKGIFPSKNTRIKMSKARMGKNNVRYNHNVTNQSIIDLINDESIKNKLILTDKKWRKIAKENNSIQCFTRRIPEINKILKTNCRTMGDVFKHIITH